MLLSPHELNFIRPKIDNVAHSKHIVPVLLDFISRLEILDRTHSLSGEQQESIEQCLERALQKVNKTTLATQRLRTSTKKGIDGEFPCMHVVVTPTCVVLEGPVPEQVSS